MYKYHRAQKKSLLGKNSTYANIRKLVLEHVHKAATGRVGSKTVLPDIVQSLNPLKRDLCQRGASRHRFGTVDSRLALTPEGSN